MESRYKRIATNERPRNQVRGFPSQISRSCWVVFLAVVSLANICILLVSLYMWRAAGSMVPSVADAPATLHTEAPGTPALAPDAPDASITLHTEAPPTPALSPAAPAAPDGLARVDALPIAYVPFYWHTPWGNPNATEADVLWDNLNTAHGHIAVDHDWAAANKASVFPSFMRWRADDVNYTVAVLNGHSRQTRKGHVSATSIPPTTLPCKYPKHISPTQAVL